VLARHAPPGHARLALSDRPRGGHREHCRSARNGPRLGPGDRTRRAHAATCPPSRGSADGRHGASPRRASRPHEIRAERQAAGRPSRAVAPSANRAKARPRGQNAPHERHNTSAQPRLGGREARCGPATRLPATRGSAARTERAARTPQHVRPAEARQTGGAVPARHAPPGRTRLALSDRPRGSQHEPCRPARNAPRLGPRPASPPPREGRRAPEGTRRPLLTRRSPQAACAEATTRSRAPSRRRAAARS